MGVLIVCHHSVPIATQVSDGFDLRSVLMLMSQQACFLYITCWPAGAAGAAGPAAASGKALFNGAAGMTALHALLMWAVVLLCITTHLNSLMLSATSAAPSLLLYFCTRSHHGSSSACNTFLPCNACAHYNCSLAEAERTAGAAAAVAAGKALVYMFAPFVVV
jgi:hypothetical protein